jgi:hypothetical protein
MYRIVMRKAFGKWPLRRPKMKCENNINMFLMEKIREDDK